MASARGVQWRQQQRNAAQMPYTGYQMAPQPVSNPQMYVQQPIPLYQAAFPQEPTYMSNGYPPQMQFGQQAQLQSTQMQFPQPVQIQNTQVQFPQQAQSFQNPYGVYGIYTPPPVRPWQQVQQPNNFQNFNNGGADRGWKRNREGAVNGKRPERWQNNGNFRGPTNRRNLRCEACNKSFVGRHQMETHMKTHVKCNVDGCSFEGIGKVVTEHRDQVHAQPNSGRKKLHKGDEDQVKQYREDRKRFFPTAANIQRKQRELQARRERGELMDEDAIRRQECLKEVLNKQQELGCPVAEIPPYYLSQRYTQKGLAANKEGGRKGKKICNYYQKGHCRKGKRCTFLHDRNTKKNDNEEQGVRVEKEGTTESRGPSLLAKLLNSEVKRDKSRLLQCFRFMANNGFFMDENIPLKFFDWQDNQEGEITADIPADITDIPSDIPDDIGDIPDRGEGEGEEGDADGDVSSDGDRYCEEEDEEHEEGQDILCCV